LLESLKYRQGFKPGSEAAAKMTTPVNERPEPTYDMDSNRHIPHARVSDDDGTFVEDELSRQHSDSHLHAAAGGSRHGRSRSGTHLTVDTVHEIHRRDTVTSPSQTREQASRLNDDLMVLQIERGLDAQEALQRGASLNRSMTRVRSRREDLVDDFDAATNPLHEQAARYSPPENPNTKFSKLFKKIHESSRLVRYFTYITPLVLLILIPLLLGALAFPRATVGGVKLVWFSIWLMIVWLTLWLGRVSITTLMDFVLLIFSRSLQNVFPGPLASSEVCSRTTARNGAIWESS
jgi:hypothetical protein